MSCPCRTSSLGLIVQGITHYAIPWRPISTNPYQTFTTAPPLRHGRRARAFSNIAAVPHRPRSKPKISDPPSVRHSSNKFDDSMYETVDGDGKVIDSESVSEPTEPESYPRYRADDEGVGAKFTPELIRSFTRKLEQPPTYARSGANGRGAPMSRDRDAETLVKKIDAEQRRSLLDLGLVDNHEPGVRFKPKGSASTFSRHIRREDVGLDFKSGRREPQIQRQDPWKVHPKGLKNTTCSHEESLVREVKQDDPFARMEQSLPAQKSKARNNRKGRFNQKDWGFDTAFNTKPRSRVTRASFEDAPFGSSEGSNVPWPDEVTEAQTPQLEKVWENQEFGDDAPHRLSKERVNRRVLLKNEHEHESEVDSHPRRGSLNEQSLSKFPTIEKKADADGSLREFPFRKAGRAHQTEPCSTVEYLADLNATSDRRPKELSVGKGPWGKFDTTHPVLDRTFKSVELSKQVPERFPQPRPRGQRMRSMTDIMSRSGKKPLGLTTPNSAPKPAPNPAKSPIGLGLGNKGGNSEKLPAWRIQKEALKAKFPEGWEPRKVLSPDAREGIRALHRQFPKEYSTPVLADKFKVSPEAIRRILKATWEPKVEEGEERDQRWERRGRDIWSQMAELGTKPPKKWREQGITRDPGWNQKTGPKDYYPFVPKWQEGSAGGSPRRKLSENLM